LKASSTALFLSLIGLVTIIIIVVSRRIARNTMSMWFKTSEPGPKEVEKEFWRLVNEAKDHVCVHSGSIDSSGFGYGFPVGKNNFAKHPWNLKVLLLIC